MANDQSKAAHGRRIGAVNAVADSVYDRVVQHIFRSGDIRPGDRVVETHLAARLGVSRIPVREALGRLRGQGLLVSDGKGQGMRLRRYSLDDIAQLYDYRELLEGGAARAAARHGSPEDIDRMSDFHEQAEKLAAEGAYESAAWVVADHGFHAALADASHNERVARALGHLLEELHGFFYGPMYHRIVASRGGTLKRSEATRHADVVVREHRGVLAAIRAGDADLAERRARHHVSHASRRLRDALAGIAAAAEAEAEAGLAKSG